MGNIDVIYKECENDYLPESPNQSEFIAIAVHASNHCSLLQKGHTTPRDKRNTLWTSSAQPSLP